MDLLQTAIKYAECAHEGERFRYVAGVYYTHVKAVSERMHTVPEKVVAVMHDVVESKVRKHLGRTPHYVAEEAHIVRALNEIALHFRANDCDIEFLLPELNILTKRGKDTNYLDYIARIAGHAARTGSLIAPKVKMADLAFNSQVDHNPSFSQQSDEDKIRLKQYAEAREFLRWMFPEISLKPISGNLKNAPGRRPERRLSRKHLRQQVMLEWDLHI